MICRSRIRSGASVMPLRFKMHHFQDEYGTGYFGDYHCFAHQEAYDYGVGGALNESAPGRELKSSDD